MAPCIVTKDELSQGVTLKAWTIIAMGTPAGVGMGFEPPGFLKAGDLVECESKSNFLCEHFIFAYSNLLSERI